MKEVISFRHYLVSKLWLNRKHIWNRQFWSIFIRFLLIFIIFIMNSQIFELFFTFSDFFTSHVFDSKSRYIRRFISFEEIRLNLLSQIFLEQNLSKHLLCARISSKQTPPKHSQHDCLREWRNEICIQLNKIMNEMTSLLKTQQLHDEIIVFEIFISHDYFEAWKKYSHMRVNFIRQKMRKTLNEYLTTFMNSEVDELVFCRSSSSLSSDLVFVFESFSFKKMRIEAKFDRLVLIVKKFQAEISIVRVAAKKYDVCRNIIINKSRVRRIMFEYFMNRQLLVSHEKKAILEFVNRFTELSFFSRLLMLREKVELILRERGQNANLRAHWLIRFLIKHSEYRTKFLRHLDQERHFNSDRIVFEKWFELFRKICVEYEIDCENIYNMNEKSYMMRIKDTVRWVLRHMLI